MTRAAPRVSVIIGSWNNGRTLRRAANSILAQTVRDLELIVIDDGSADDTPEVARSIRDPRARYVRLPHMGISRSLNIGLLEAQAEYVAIQDADDWSFPDRLERQLAVLESRPEIGVVGCRMREVDGEGREFTARFGRASGDVTRHLMRFNPIPNTSATFRKSAILACGSYDARFRYAMEYDLWLRVAETHLVVNLPDELAARELSETNVAARSEREQIRETLRLKSAALRRRRTLRGASGLVRPALALVAPDPVKRLLRRARGQRP